MVHWLIGAGLATGRRARVTAAGGVLASEDDKPATGPGVSSERLLAAGYEDLEVAELPAALADLLRESEQPLVV